MQQPAADPPPRRDRELQRELLPLAPFLYIVWADGVLSADELRTVREIAGRTDLPDERGRAALRAWLDPEDPPSATELAGLLEIVHAWCGERARPAHGDLVRLAERIAVNSNAQAGAAVYNALTELQNALGVAGEEAARALLPDPVEVAPPPAPRAPFHAAALRAFVDGDTAAVRARVLNVLTGDAFRYVDTRDTHAYREQVLRWCRTLAEHGFGALAFPAEFGGNDDVAGSIAAFETIAFHDLSLLVKYGVHFGLFGGSIYLLGTRSHHERYLRDVATLELPGCFAMTETGHGSNVRDIGTTATWDAGAGGFIIDTPDPAARKDYIGNAALHGRLAVVFAQLHTAAGAHGVHAFVVPIRGPAGDVLPGVEIEDCGLKAGLNGVDNGRIAFHQVRIPRENLLDRYGSVSDAGVYTSPIASPGRRFFTMLGTLVAGRISIACAALSAAKSGLAIAVPYADQRRQFGPEGRPEVPVLDYLTMQRRLLPALATAWALDIALQHLVRSFAAHAGDDDTRELETHAAALKAFTTDWALETLQHCREACGGSGFLADNRIGALRADADIFTTFEGANPVLYQLVARGRLTEYRDQFGELRLWNVARVIGARAATRLTELNPVAVRRTDREHLIDPAFHLAALRYREERLLSSLARRLRERIRNGMDSFDALNECQDHAVELGRAFADRFVVEQMQAALDRCTDPDLADVLGRLAALHGLSRLEAASGWLQEAGYVEGGKSRAIRGLVNDLCRELRPLAVPLVAAFGIPDRLLEGAAAGVS